MEEFQKIVATILLSIIWFVFFRSLDGGLKWNYSRKKKLFLVNCIFTAIFGVIVAWMSLTALLICSTKELNSKSSHTVDYILIFSLSYFISHAVLYAQHPSMQTFASFPHHIFSIIYFGMYLFYQKKEKHLPVIGLFLGQVTALNLSILDYLNKVNLRYTKTFQICADIFIFTYLIMRGLLLPFLAWTTLFSPKLHFLTKITAVFFSLFSMEVNRRLINIFRKSIQRAKEMREKSIEFDWLCQDKQKLSQLSFYGAPEY